MGLTPNAALPFPEMSDTPNVPRDIKALAEKLDEGGSLPSAGLIDVDTVGDTDFGTDGPPLQLYGTGRPDRFGGGLITAPTGSTYTCTTPDTTGTNGNYGAIQWVKDYFRGWVVTVGQTRQYQISKTPNWDNSGSPTAGQLRWTINRDANGIMMYARGHQTFQSAANLSQDLFLDDTLETWFGSTTIATDLWGSNFSNQFWHGATTSTTTTIIGQVRLQIANPSRPSGDGNAVFNVFTNGASPPSNDQRLHMYVGVQGGWPYGSNVGEEYTWTMYISELESQIAAAAKDNPELAEQLKAELEALQAGE